MILPTSRNQNIRQKCTSSEKCSSEYGKLSDMTSVKNIKKKNPVNIRVPHKRTLQSYLLNKLEQLIRSGGGGRGEEEE